MRKIVRPLIGLLLLAMPLPMGANRTWMLLVLLAGVLVVAGCAAAAAAVGGRLSSRLHVLRGPFWLAAAWLGLLLAQGHLGTGFALEAGGAETRGELVAVLDTYPQWVPLSLYPDATWHDLGYALFGFGLFFLVVFAVRIARHAYLLLGFVLLSAFVQAGFGAWEYLASQDFPTLAALTDRPINGTFLNRNHFAGYLAMAAGVLVGLLIGRVFEEDEAGNGQSSWLVRMLFVLTGRGMLAIGLVAPLLVVIAASGSRGAMAGLLLALVAGLALVSASQGRWRLGGALVASVVALVVVLAWNSPVFDRSLRAVTDGLADGRLAEWRISVMTISSRPLTGFGAGSFTDAYALHRDGSLHRNQTFDHAHNQYLELLVECGLVGLLLLGGFVLLVLRQAYRLWLVSSDPRIRIAALGALFGMLTALGHALFEFTFEIPAISAAFLVLAGCVTALSVWTLPSRRRRDPMDGDTASDWVGEARGP